jgi:hypothetical protein
VGVALSLSAALLALVPAASARTVRIDARARVGVVSAASGDVHFAGALRDARLGAGGLLMRVRRGAGGRYAGTLSIVDGRGSLRARLSARATPRGSLLGLSSSARITAATGRYRGATGTLKARATLTGDRGVGDVRLTGTLRGAVGSSPAPTRGTRTHDMAARLHGTSVGLKRNGQEMIVAAVTGVVPGTGVVVLRVARASTRLRSAFTLYGGAGTLTGRIDVLRGSGSGGSRTDTGTAEVTGGTGRYLGARTPKRARVRGTRDLVRQLIALRIRGQVAW